MAPSFFKKAKKGEKRQDSMRFGARRIEFLVLRLPPSKEKLYWVIEDSLVTNAKYIDTN